MPTPLVWRPGSWRRPSRAGSEGPGHPATAPRNGGCIGARLQWYAGVRHGLGEYFQEGQALLDVPRALHVIGIPPLDPIPQVEVADFGELHELSHHGRFSPLACDGGVGDQVGGNKCAGALGEGDGSRYLIQLRCAGT